MSGETRPARKDGTRSGGIQSLERAFGILEEVARHDDGISLVEIGRTLDIHTAPLITCARR